MSPLSNRFGNLGAFGIDLEGQTTEALVLPVMGSSPAEACAHIDNAHPSAHRVLEALEIVAQKLEWN